MKQHKHAELIKQWADNQDLEFEYLSAHDDWRSTECPKWGLCTEYRIKTSAPGRVYPVTKMRWDDFSLALPLSIEVDLFACETVANAAIKHAINAGQVFTTEYAAVSNRVEADHMAFSIAYSVAMAQSKSADLLSNAQLLAIIEESK